MSFQIQLTIPKETIQNNNIQQPIPLFLTTSTKQKIENLVADLELTPHISQELKKELQNWKIQALDVYFDSISTNEEKEMAADILTILFLDVIRPAMFSAKTNKAVKILSNFNKQFKQILKPLIPKDDEYKTFLDKCDSATSNIAEFQLLTKLNSQYIANINAWFINNCNALSQKYLDHFELIQQELCSLVNRWEDEADAVADELQLLSKKLLSINEHLITLDLVATKVGQDLMAEDAKLDIIIAECSEILAKGVK